MPAWSCSRQTDRPLLLCSVSRGRHKGWHIHNAALVVLLPAPTAAISFMLHLDKHMSAMIQQHGTATYAILWTIVFCETGLVLTPFLPGDSLLFAAGAFAGESVAARPEPKLCRTWVELLVVRWG